MSAKYLTKSTKDEIGHEIELAMRKYENSMTPSLVLLHMLKEIAAKKFDTPIGLFGEGYIDFYFMITPEDLQVDSHEELDKLCQKTIDIMLDDLDNHWELYHIKEFAKPNGENTLSTFYSLMLYMLSRIGLDLEDFEEEVFLAKKMYKC